MTQKRRNDRLGSEYRSSEVIAEGQVLESWGSFHQLASCVIAVSLDPLFLYIPVINHHENCFDFDKKLRIAALVLRTVTDFIFMLHIAFQLRNVCVMTYCVCFGDLYETYMSSYSHSYFLIDILSLLPLPQVVILSIIPNMKGSKSLMARDVLTALVLLQYVPRVVRIYPLYKNLTWTPRIFRGTPWTKAALNLFLYMLASHVLGASWYFLSIEREITCWQEACEGHPGCEHSSFFCDDGIRATEFLHDMCPVDTPNANLFDFGIFLDALQSGIVESVNLPQKFFRCLWWGLQNLSSLGQNLKTSTYVWENIFTVFISTSGLVLFLYLIGNMQIWEQTYMQLKTIKQEEKRMEISSAVDSWMSKIRLPNRMKSRIKHSVEKKWHEIRTVDSENLIPILPMDLRKPIKRYLCADLVRRVPVFAWMDYQQLDAMFGRLKPAVYSKGSDFVQRGDPVEMCFIFYGKVLMKGWEGHEFKAVELQTGDFFGEELLTWFLNGSPADLPISSKIARALTEVEVYTLKAEDLKVLIIKIWKTHGNKLLHILRCYSGQWKTWAARVIQRAWRRYAKRKLQESRREEEIRLQDAIDIIKALGLHKPAEPDFEGEDSSYRWRE